MNLEAIKEDGQIVELKLIAIGKDDVEFLTRLQKAMLFNDEITIDMGAGQVMSYLSGCSPDVAEALEWKNVNKE